MSLAIKPVTADSFGIIPGPGFVITRNGKRLDWPMLTTLAEAEADLADFRRTYKQLAADESSERHGLSLMGAL